MEIARKMQQPKRIIWFGIRYIYALLSFFYLFLAGFLFSKNRDLIEQICVHFGLTTKRAQTIIPKAKLAEIIDAQLPVQVVEIERVSGNVRPLELLVVNLFAKVFKPNSIFEIGTFDGRTTLNLAINSPPVSKVYTIDLPKYSTISTALPVTSGDKVYIHRNVTGARYHNKDENALPEKNKIIELYGDTATFDFTPYFNKMDLVFIDGAHSYEYVLNDSKIGLKLLKNGKGVIIWHDYDVWDGVTKALNELQSQNPEFKFLHIEHTSLVCLILR